MSCKDKIEARCGKKTAAPCVTYEGTLSTKTQLDPNDCHNMEEVIEDINDQLDAIVTNSNLDGLNNDCINYNLGGEVTVKQAILALHAKMLAVMDKIGMSCDNCPSCPEACPSFLTEDLSCLNLNFGTLTDPCGNKPTTLEEVLQLILTTIQPA